MHRGARGKEEELGGGGGGGAGNDCFINFLYNDHTNI